MHLWDCVNFPSSATLKKYNAPWAVVLQIYSAMEALELNCFRTTVEVWYIVSWKKLLKCQCSCNISRHWPVHQNTFKYQTWDLSSEIDGTREAVILRNKSALGFHRGNKIPDSSSYDWGIIVVHSTHSNMSGHVRYSANLSQIHWNVALHAFEPLCSNSSDNPPYDLYNFRPSGGKH